MPSPSEKNSFTHSLAPPLENLLSGPVPVVLKHSVSISVGSQLRVITSISQSVIRKRKEGRKEGGKERKKGRKKERQKDRQWLFRSFWKNLTKCAQKYLTYKTWQYWNWFSYHYWSEQNCEFTSCDTALTNIWMTTISNHWPCIRDCWLVFLRSSKWCKLVSRQGFLFFCVYIQVQLSPINCAKILFLKNFAGFWTVSKRFWLKIWFDMPWKLHIHVISSYWNSGFFTYQISTDQECLLHIYKEEQVLCCLHSII